MDAQLLKIKKQMIRAIGLIDSNKIENIGRAKGLLEMLVKEVDHEEKLFLAFMDKQSLIDALKECEENEEVSENDDNYHDGIL
tara:strand:+ start:559 stop:807 length:249 start_codon:yes stop_codon:yes gene_type:complete